MSKPNYLTAAPEFGVEQFEQWPPRYGFSELEGCGCVVSVNGNDIDGLTPGSLRFSATIQ